MELGSPLVVLLVVLGVCIAHIQLRSKLGQIQLEYQNRVKLLLLHLWEFPIYDLDSSRCWQCFQESLQFRYPFQSLEQCNQLDILYLS